MGLNLETPIKAQDGLLIYTPGIDGKFYDGPTDNLLRKFCEELQKEQP